MFKGLQFYIMKNTKKIITKNLVLAALLFVGLIFVSSYLGPRNNIISNNQTMSLTANQCGSAGPLNTGSAVKTSINFGCNGNKCANGSTQGYCSQPHNGIIDLTFAIIRFLSNGVGIVVIASIIVGGIQYIGSSGDPNNTNKAIGRIRSSIIALIVYIFAYAILNYLIPGAFFNQ